MDKSIIDLLNNLKIKFDVVKHPALFRVRDHETYNIKIPGQNTKNLFLKSDSGELFLVCMCAEKRLNFKSLCKYLYVEKISLASESDLLSHLSIKPGSVSIFCMLNQSGDVRLIIDEDVLNSARSSHHAGSNTSTLIFSRGSLKRILKCLPGRKEIVKIE